MSLTYSTNAEGIESIFVFIVAMYFSKNIIPASFLQTLAIKSKGGG